MITTLLSDFGNRDNAVAIAKGIILKYNPMARLIDLSHEVMPYNLLECSYLLRSAYIEFPENTIHVCMFDIMHVNPASILIAFVDQQIVISADNRFIPNTFYNKELNILRYKKRAANYKEWFNLVGEVIQLLNDHAFDIENYCDQNIEFEVGSTLLKPIIRENYMECQVIHIDNFGNVILNVTDTLFEEIKGERKFKIEIPRYNYITKLHSNYNEVHVGDIICLFNNAGYLELSIREGSAAKLFGLELYSKDQLIYKYIKISFE